MRKKQSFFVDFSKPEKVSTAKAISLSESPFRKIVKLQKLNSPYPIPLLTQCSKVRFTSFVFPPYSHL